MQTSYRQQVVDLYQGISFVSTKTENMTLVGRSSMNESQYLNTTTRDILLIHHVP